MNQLYTCSGSKRVVSLLCSAADPKEMPAMPTCNNSGRGTDLRVCNKADEPGHESHNSSKHRFTTHQLQEIRQLTDLEAAKRK